MSTKKSRFQVSIYKLLVSSVFYLLFSNMAAAQSFADFSLGGNNICVIDPDGVIECATRRIDVDIHLPPDDGTLYSSVSSGLSHSCAITQSGELRCWGSNNFGQLDAPSSDVGFVSLSASGGHHTCAIDANMQAHCWGLNTAGQTNVPEPNTGFVSVHTSTGSSCGIKESEELVCWTTDTQITRNLPENPGYTDLVLGQGGRNVQSCGLTQDGAIDCWASNSFSVEVPSGGPYTQIASNNLWLCGLTADGILDCNFGITGSSFVDNRNVGLLNDISSLPPLSGFEILTQSSTITSLCGLTLDGELVCVGESLPAVSLPGSTDVPIVDIPVVENFRFATYSDTTIELFWDIFGFRTAGTNIYRDGELLTFTNNSASFIDDTLEADQEYVYTVALVGFTGIEGPLSEPILVSTDDRGQSVTDGVADTSLSHPGQPTNLSITRYGDFSLELFWERPTFNVRYQVFRNGEFLAFAAGPSYFDDSVNPDTAYHYTIVVVERSGPDVIGVGFVNEPALN